MTVAPSAVETERRLQAVEQRLQFVAANLAEARRDCAELETASTQHGAELLKMATVLVDLTAALARSVEASQRQEERFLARIAELEQRGGFWRK